MTTMERRLEPREGCVMIVDYTFGGRAYTEFTRDISRRGVCIESNVRTPVGCDLTLVITPPEGEPIKLQGKVVWINAGQTGIHLQ
jgi:hypothetical protein